MELLQNKWIRILAVLGMILWIFSSNTETVKIVDYVKDTDNVKKDISYTVSKTREAMAISKMTEEEIKEYYLKKQNEQKEADLIKTDNNSLSANEKISPKVEQNLSGIAKLQEAMRRITEKEAVNEQIEAETLSDNSIFQPTEEEKLFVEKFVAEKYGQLTVVKERVIKCGDYVSFNYMLYEGYKKIIPEAMKMNILVGSGVLPEIEQILTGMFHGQKKKFDVVAKKQSGSAEGKKISQEIKILSIKEIEKKELLDCK
jgi:hypothetical protein